jgi:N-acetylglucosamine-6-sulfatase
MGVLRQLLAACVAAAASAAAPPNMVFVFLDDLDVEMGSSSPTYMPLLHELIAAPGASFSRAYVSVPVCCPSRSSLYTGTYQHNNGVAGNEVVSNCSSAAWQAGPEKRTFPIQLQAAGYRTYFSGKYLNDYGFPAEGGTAHVPPGWSDWHGLVGNSAYYNYTLSNNGVSEPHGDAPADYLPTIVHQRGMAFINASVKAGAPFFAYLSFPSCHGPQEAEAQYQHLYPDAQAPRTPNYNASVPNSHWLQAVQAVYGLDANAAAFADLVYRRRLQTLRSVDAAIADIVTELTRLAVLNNTYIVFSADNGYHTGTFGLIYDKRQPWETDVHVPLFARGPGIAAGTNVSALVSMPDLAATFLDMAGLQPPAAFDGTSWLPWVTGGAAPLPPARQFALVEYVGESSGGGDGAVCARTEGSPMFCGSDGTYRLPPLFNGSAVCVCQDSANSTYQCLRAHTSAGENYRYCEFQDAANTVEYFDFAVDRYELHNAAATLTPTRKAALSARLAAAKACVGSAACDAVLAQPL